MFVEQPNVHWRHEWRRVCMEGHVPDEAGTEGSQWSSLHHVYYPEGRPYRHRRKGTSVSDAVQFWYYSVKPEFLQLDTI